MVDEYAPEVVKIHANTYHMGPRDGEKIQPGSKNEDIKKVMEAFLVDKEWDVDNCKAWSLEMSDQLKVMAKTWVTFEHDKAEEIRYKISAQVIFGECAGQGSHTASRCLWDEATDNYISASAKNVSYLPPPRPRSKGPLSRFRVARVSPGTAPAGRMAQTSVRFLALTAQIIVLHGVFPRPHIQRVIHSCFGTGHCVITFVPVRGFSYPGLRVPATRCPHAALWHSMLPSWAGPVGPGAEPE